MFHSKIDVNEALRGSEPLVLDVGCGSRKFRSAAIGIDVIDAPSVDIVGDVFEVLRSLPPKSISEIHAYHFLEHINEVGIFISECARVLEVGGLLRIVVPHFSNPYFYSDPTHDRFFGLYSMSYLVESNLFKRSVPNYAHDLTSGLKLDQVSLRFKAPREFPFSYGLMYAFGLLIDFNRASQEFYERWLTGVLPCYEVSYEIRKTECSVKSDQRNQSE